MARIVICEPSPAVASLLAEVVRGLGHEPVLVDARATAAPEAHALLVEPAAEGALDLVHAFRLPSPELPVVFVSIRSPLPEALALDPVAYLVKPFAISDLEEALGRALSSRA